jgi:hypothetical protein
MTAHREDLIEKRLTELIIGAFFRVYNRLGFGFLENYDGEELTQYRLDMVDK